MVFRGPGCTQVSRYVFRGCQTEGSSTGHAAAQIQSNDTDKTEGSATGRAAAPIQSVAEGAGASLERFAPAEASSNQRKRPMIVRPDFTTLSCLTATLAIGLMLIATTDIALAETVKRDHRGSSGAPQGGVTVNGKPAKVIQAPKIGGPKWKGGYDKLGGSGEKGAKSGVTVRDHRSCGWGPGRPNRPCG